jgi:hypothetical protein
MTKSIVLGCVCVACGILLSYLPSGIRYVARLVRTWRRLDRLDARLLALRQCGLGWQPQILAALIEVVDVLSRDPACKQIAPRLNAIKSELVAALNAVKGGQR